jgi:hypothetical protein
MKLITTVLALGMVAVLGACAGDPHQALSPDFGQSVRANITAQVVNPNPTYGVAESDGTRIQNAIHRYETNKVYLPHLPLEGGQIYDNGGQQQSGSGGSSN